MPVIFHILLIISFIHFSPTVLFLQMVSKFPTANGHYAHKSFIETEFSHGTDAKKTWLKCQSYEYEENPGTIPTAISDIRKRTVRQSARLTLYGKLAVDFFSCEKHSVSGVTLRISLRRSQEDFAVISEDAAKHHKVKIDEANLFIRKMTVSDNNVGAIEKTLLKTPAIYRYNEGITKTFFATTGQQSWKHEDIFTKEPIRRVIVALCVGTAFIGTNTAIIPLSKIWFKRDNHLSKWFCNGWNSNVNN